MSRQATTLRNAKSTPPAGFGAILCPLSASSLKQPREPAQLPLGRITSGADVSEPALRLFGVDCPPVAVAFHFGEDVSQALKLSNQPVPFESLAP